MMLIITPIIWLWSMAAMVVAMRQVLDYTDTFKAVIVVLIGFGVTGVLGDHDDADVRGRDDGRVVAMRFGSLS